MEYFFYSGATDVTGAALAEKLGAKGGIEVPKDKFDIVVGWGCKTDKDTEIKNAKHVLNRPMAIRLNRNKLEALKVMNTAKVPVAEFIAVERKDEQVRNRKELEALGFPLIGRLKFHQGGHGLWTIVNKATLDAALNEGCGYVQKLLDIKNEYRIHIFCGNIIYQVMKVPQEDPAKSWAAQAEEKLGNKSDKEKVKLDKNTMAFILQNLAKEHSAPNYLVRSNTRGWKFSRTVALPKNMGEIAIKAVQALDLDFGAVDMAENKDGNVFVLEVNTAPGLEGTAFEAWEKAFRTKFAEMKKVEKKVVAKKGGDKEFLQNFVDDLNEDEAKVFRKVLLKMKEH